MEEQSFKPAEITYSFSPYVPFYPESQITYTNMVSPFAEPYEYTSWREEQLSWETTCYIHGNLNPSPTYRISGPEAKDFLAKYCVNTFENFPVGTGKHGFVCAPDGNIMSDGCLTRTGENEYITYWMMALAMFAQQDGTNYDMSFEDISAQRALLQVAGPKSLQTIEKAFQQDLHDLKFNHLRTIEFEGIPIEVYRMGMGGTLAYELHLPIEFSPRIYDTIYQAGKEFGIKRLGFFTYIMQHGMNGCAQFGAHFGVPGFTTTKDVAGSMADMPFEVFFHNPYEIGQGACVKYDHEFIGKEALLVAKDNHRVMVSLEWDADDVADVYRSQFTDNPYMPFLGPTDFDSHGVTLYHDKVLNAKGELVGASTGRTHTLYYHKMISICYLDPEYATEGTELTLIWGNPGTRQKEIKVTVARYPYFNENPNRTFDVETIPHLNA